MTEREAADSFVTRLVARAYEGAATSTIKALSEKTVGRHRREVVSELSDWYLELDALNKDKVSKLIYEVARQSTFGSCVVLDGASGGYPVKDRPSKFLLTLQVYSDDDMSELEQTVQVNDGPEDLHDVFHELIDGPSAT